MSYKLVWEDKGLLIKFSEIVSSMDLIKSNSDFIGDARIETVDYIISDFTDIKGINLNESDVEVTKNFAVRTNPLNPMAKLAIVSSRKELINLVDAFILKSKSEISHANYKHFMQIKEAREWVTS